MSAFFYGLWLQLKLDIRSKTMLITCYLVPLIFFFFMGGIFTSITPESRFTLIQSMTVFVVSMGALIGLPPSVVEVYGSDIKKVYKANRIPMFQGIITQFLSAYIHLFVMCMIVLAVSPLAYNAALPKSLGAYFGSLALFLAVSLSIGSLLGLLCKTQSKLTMISQVIFLPSIMLSGIMFPANMLPSFLQYAGYIFPATSGFLAMTDFRLWHLLTLAVILLAAVVLVALLLKRLARR